MKDIKTAVFEIRCDLRTLAAVARYYTKHGVSFDSRSALGRGITEDFLSVLIKNNEATEVESTAEAIEILAAIGLTGFNRGGRGHKALVEQLRIESSVQSTSNEDFMQSLFKRVEE